MTYVKVQAEWFVLWLLMHETHVIKQSKIPSVMFNK